MNRTQTFLKRSWNQQEEPEVASIWLISFTDLMALMLTFFVLMFSMSDPQRDRWENFTHSLTEKTGSFKGASLNRGPEDAINIERINYGRALDLSYLQSLISNMIAEEKDLARIEVVTQADSLRLSIPADLLFEAGQADVAEGGSKMLYTLSETLSRLQNRIEIVGNVDPGPVISPSYSSTWDLSLARAIAVSGVLQSAGYNKPVTVRGGASGVFDALGDNVPDAQRRAQANRTDIIIMEDDGNQVTVFTIGKP